MLLKDISPFVRFARQFAISGEMPSVQRRVQTRDNRMFFVVDGQGSIDIDDRSYPLKRHTLVILHAGEVYRINPCGKLSLIVINFDYTYAFSSIKDSFSPVSSGFMGVLEDTVFEDADSLHSSLVISDGARFEDSLRSVLRDLGNRWELCDSYRSALIKTVIIDAVLSESDNKKGRDASSRLADNVARYLKEHYSEPVENETLAEQFHFTSVYINRVFKREMGTTVRQYLISVRIDNAKELLRSREYTPSETAVMVGFDDYPHFSKTFKAIVGMTPSEYCRQHGSIE